MAWYRCGGGGIPSSLKGNMNDVFNKKFGTVLQDYPPEDWPGTVSLMGPLPERTVTGSVVAFADGADAVKLKSCAVTIAPTLDGVSSVDVVHGGKNFVDDNLTNLEQGTIDGDHGTNTVSNTRVRNANYTSFPYDEIYPNYKLTIPNGWKIAIRFYKSDNTYVTLPSWAIGFVTILPSDLVGQGVTKARFVFAKTDNSAITPEDVKNVGFQLEVGSTETDYKPFIEPTTHTAQLGRTIYGGSVDVENGTGTDENGNDFTFTPVPILSRLGDNTMWGDGDLSVTYRRDIDLALAQ